MQIDRTLRALAATALVMLTILIVVLQRERSERQMIADVAEHVSALTLADLQMRHALIRTRLGVVEPGHLAASSIAFDRAAAALISSTRDDPDLRAGVRSLLAHQASRHGLVRRFVERSALDRESHGQKTAARTTGGVTDRGARPKQGSSAASVGDVPSAIGDADTTIDRLSRSDAADLPLDEVDAILRSLEADGFDRLVSSFVGIIKDRSAASASSRARTWSLVLVAAVVLLSSVVALALRLVERLRQDWRQGEAEHLSASVAATFLSSEIGEEEEAFVVALEKIASHVHASSVTFSADGFAVGRVRCWPPTSPSLPRFVVSMAEAGREAGWDGCMRVVRDDEVGRGGMTLIRHRDWPDALMGIAGGPIGAGLLGEPMMSAHAALGTLAKAAHRLMVETERRDMERRLAESERLEVVGTIASGVAHNFNNIICAIGGFAEIASARVRRGSAIATNLDEIRSAASRAQVVVNDMLGLAARGTSDVRRLSLRPLLEETQTLLQANRGGRFETILDPREALQVTGNVARLQQVLLNICNNAFDACDGAGTVRVDVTATRTAIERPLSHGALRAGRWIVVRISDDGPGIPDEVRTRLFEPFFTTRAGGTGLGLSTSWQIVADHGGTINVPRGARPGGVLEVWLPAAGREDFCGGNGERVVIVAPVEDADRYEELVARSGCEPIYEGVAPSGASRGDALLLVSPPVEWATHHLDLFGDAVPILVVAKPGEAGIWCGIAREIVDAAEDEASILDALKAILTSDGSGGGKEVHAAKVDAAPRLDAVEPVGRSYG